MVDVVFGERMEVAGTLIGRTYEGGGDALRGGQFSSARSIGRLIRLLGVLGLCVVGDQFGI